MDEAGPWRIFAVPAASGVFDGSDYRALGLLDYHRDRLLEAVWTRVVQLLTPPSAGGGPGGWLWDDGTGVAFN